MDLEKINKNLRFINYLNIIIILKLFEDFGLNKSLISNY